MLDQIGKYAAFPAQAAWRGLKSAAGAQRHVWLTFDDGPHPVHTPRILETLDRHGIRGTFFVVGQRALEHPGLLREMAAAGHRIGNHSFSHPDLRTLDQARVREELLRAEDAIGSCLGTSKLFRPPHGARNAGVDEVAAALGYRTVLWDVSTRDWRESYQPDRWVAHTVRLARIWGEARILLHDTVPTTAEHFATFVDRLADLPRMSFMPPAGLDRFAD